MILTYAEFMVKKNLYYGFIYKLHFYAVVQTCVQKFKNIKTTHFKTLVTKIIYNCTIGLFRMKKKNCKVEFFFYINYKRLLNVLNRTTNDETTSRSDDDAATNAPNARCMEGAQDS